LKQNATLRKLSEKELNGRVKFQHPPPANTRVEIEQIYTSTHPLPSWQGRSRGIADKHIL